MAKWLKNILTVAMIAVFAVGSSVMIAGCDKDPEETTVEDVQDAAQDAADDAGEAVDDVLNR